MKFESDMATGGYFFLKWAVVASAMTSCVVATEEHGPTSRVNHCTISTIFQTLLLKLEDTFKFFICVTTIDIEAPRMFVAFRAKNTILELSDFSSQLFAIVHFTIIRLEIERA